jgi:hypothetical protein
MARAPDQAYHLRCWQANGQWRFSVARISQERRRRDFHALEHQLAFLRTQLWPPEQAPSTPLLRDSPGYPSAAGRHRFRHEVSVHREEVP